MKLLLIEDQVELANNIREYFSREGDICEVAFSISEGLDKLSSFEYDVLLLDLMLPDGDGLTLLSQVRTGPKRIIGLSIGNCPTYR